MHGKRTFYSLYSYLGNFDKYSSISGVKLVSDTEFSVSNKELFLPYPRGEIGSFTIKTGSMKKRLEEMGNEELWQLFPVIISEHDPQWAERYRKESERLKELLGESIGRIQHIGSTAVPDIPAKPTIDILIELTESADLARVVDFMKKDGYIYCPRPENPAPHMMFMKGYTEAGFRGQAFHVHVRYRGDWDEPYFRDYLCAHPEEALEYGRLKIRLQQQFEHDRDAYTAAKTDFIMEIVNKAREALKQNHSNKPAIQ